MRGVGNLTRAAYANQRMTLNSEIGKISKQRRNTMVALRGAIRVACFIIHVLSRAFADALLRREEMRHATFFCLCDVE